MQTLIRGTQVFSSLILMILSLGVVSEARALDLTEDDYELKLLGKFVFFDNISSPSVQSCASCHAPRTGGTGDSSLVNRTQVAITGANPHAMGSLKPPTNAYATLIPIFQDSRIHSGLNCGPTPFCGGNFWNGRAVGFGGDTQISPDGIFTSTHVIADTVVPADLVERYVRYLGPTADQALNPFPNDNEQNVPVSPAEANGDGLRGAEAVCRHVQRAKYSDLYKYAWGERINCSTEGSPRAVDISFQRIAIALSAYQGSSEINSFSSKRDWAVRTELACFGGGAGEFARYYKPWVCAAKSSEKWGKFPLAVFSDKENFGHDLFYGVTSTLNSGGDGGQGKNAQCTECHVTRKDVGEKQLVTDRQGNLVEVIVPDGTALDERYTDDTYHNIGTPWNPQLTNPECAADDDACFEGLAGHAFAAGFGGGRVGVGSRKVPTLRNVDKRPNKHFIKAYGANGWFKSLESIVHFYNTSTVDFNCVITADEDCTDPGTRGPGGQPEEVAYEELTAAQFGVTRCEDRASGWTEAEALAANCWPRAEFPGAPGQFIGNLGLTADEEAALVAYMKTFTDQVTARPPQQYELLMARLKHERGHGKVFGLKHRPR